MFYYCCFVSKHFLHFWHCYASTVFFTWIIIYIRLYMSCLWEQFPDKILYQKTWAKKALTFFGSRFEINIYDIFYKSQNFNWWPVCLVITHWTYTFLSPWALDNRTQHKPACPTSQLSLFLYWETRSTSSSCNNSVLHLGPLHSTPHFTLTCRLLGISVRLW